MVPSSFARVLVDAAVALDAHGFALARAEPVPDPEVDGELARTGRALALCMEDFGLRIRDFDLTLVRVDPAVRQRRDAAHEAGHAVVAAKLGLDVAAVTLNPDYPEGEVQFGRVGSSVLERDAAMSAEDRAALRPTAEAMVVVLLAGGLAEAMLFGQVPTGAGHDHMVAAGVRQFFALEASDDHLYQRAADLVAENVGIIKRVALALRLGEHLSAATLADY